jgi:hypothetical protein
MKLHAYPKALKRKVGFLIKFLYPKFMNPCTKIRFNFHLMDQVECIDQRWVPIKSKKFSRITPMGLQTRTFMVVLIVIPIAFTLSLRSGRHEEYFLSIRISLGSFLVIIHDIEKQLQAHNTKIMDILEEYRNKFMELEAKCYKLKCTTQHLCKEPFFEVTSQ